MNVLRPIQEEFYGDNSRWFFGNVINSSPPAGLEGRVKVRIIGVHNPDTKEIPERDLPWCQVLIPTTEGGSSGIGRIPQLANGAFVFGTFLDGTSSQIPLVLGSLPHIELPSSIQKQRVGSFTDQFTYDTNRIQNVVITPLIDDNKPTVDVGLRRQQCMKFFIDNGYEVIHAASITGALEEISKFTTYTINRVDEQTTAGIARWKVAANVGNRYTGLLRFSVAYKPTSDWQSFSVQLQYVLFELRTRFNLANSKLIATSDIKNASRVFNQFYLKRDIVTERLAQQAYEEVFI